MAKNAAPYNSSIDIMVVDTKPNAVRLSPIQQLVDHIAGKDPVPDELVAFIEVGLNRLVGLHVARRDASASDALRVKLRRLARAAAGIAEVIDDADVIRTLERAGGGPNKESPSQGLYPLLISLAQRAEAAATTLPTKRGRGKAVDPDYDQTPPEQVCAEIIA